MRKVFRFGSQRVLVVCGALLLTILVLEVAVRMAGETNADGRFKLGSYDLPPYVLPLDKLRVKVNHYLTNRDEATKIPDPETGWTYKPNSVRDNGRFTINSSSLRSRREYTMRPAEDTLRIALFGDSFVAGDEVNDDEVWGYQLEKLLIQAGRNAEALNFGVGGYGMGQAFLRWKHSGKGYSPDIVIFVFQAENLDRNVNVFRLLYQGGVVYSKPRFILAGDSLELINSPALPPEEIMAAFESFDSLPLAKYEAHYRGSALASSLWNVSRLAGLIYAVRHRLYTDWQSSQMYGRDSERGNLGKAIVEAFASDVVASGAEFIVVHLPRKDHFRKFHEGQRAPYRFLLDHFRKTYHFISAEDFLDVKYTDDSYYQPGWHYGPEINLKVAEAVASYLVACIENGTCGLARFQADGGIRNQG